MLMCSTASSWSTSSSTTAPVCTTPLATNSLPSSFWYNRPITSVISLRSANLGGLIQLIDFSVSTAYTLKYKWLRPRPARGKQQKPSKQVFGGFSYAVKYFFIYISDFADQSFCVYHPYLRQKSFCFFTIHRTH